MSTLRGRYTRSDDDGLYVAVAEYGSTREFGPCQSTLDVTPNVGSVLIVEQVGGLDEDMVVVGLVGRASGGGGGGSGGGNEVVVSQYQPVTDGSVELWVDTTAPDLAPSAGLGIKDGDWGDITVSGTGTVWTIDNGAVTKNKLDATYEADLLHKAGSETVIGIKTFTGGDGTGANAGGAGLTIKTTGTGNNNQPALRLENSGGGGAVVRLNQFGVVDVLTGDNTAYNQFRAGAIYDSDQRVYSAANPPPPSTKNAKVAVPAVSPYTWTTVTHNLSATALTHVMFQDASTKEEVQLDWKERDANSIQVWSGVSITASTINALCIGA